MTQGEGGRADPDADLAGDGAADGAGDPPRTPDGGEVVADPDVDADTVDADTDAGADADPVDADPEADTPPTADLDGDGLAALAAEDWRAALAAVGELRPPVLRAIIDTHGDRGRRAIEAVSEGRVKRYRDFTVVVGHRAEHVVEDGGCDCQDAAYNLDPADPDERCWHALAVDVAERVGRVDVHDMWYSEVHEFL